jgi:hypothetical protein
LLSPNCSSLSPFCDKKTTGKFPCIFRDLENAFFWKNRVDIHLQIGDKESTTNEDIMNYSESIDLAKRLESLIRRTATFGKTTEDVLDEIQMIAQDLRKQADEYDRQMNEEYLKSC